MALYFAHVLLALFSHDGTAILLHTAATHIISPLHLHVMCSSSICPFHWFYECYAICGGSPALVCIILSFGVHYSQCTIDLRTVEQGKQELSRS